MTGPHGGGHDGPVDLDAFVRDGYVAVRGAVEGETAAACRELIWAAMERRGVRRDDPGSWPPLMEGMDDLAGEPFVTAFLAPALTAAYDELIGPGRWERLVRSVDLGETVVVRFPAEDERANAGYHIEGSYAAPDGSSAGWVNIRSRNRGLLALFLFTDVGHHDAPTRLLCGSHLAVPQFLAPYGEAGTDSDAEFWRPSTLCMTVAHATGRAGDVFLCHPFVVHTATWPHRGSRPADDRPARGQRPGRLRAGWFRSFAGSPGYRHGTGDGGLRHLPALACLFLLM